MRRLRKSIFSILGKMLFRAMLLFMSEIYGVQLNGILKIINNNSEYFSELMFFLKEIN